MVSIAEKLDPLFATWNRNDAPGLVAGVSHKGERIYERGFGLASIEHATQNSPSMRMRIGSTTKQFNCVGILMLAEEGKLDLDQPVRTYLPELKDSPAGDPTLLQLMQHTGGVRDPMASWFLMNFGGYGHMPAGSSLQLMQRFTERNFAPGESMAYSNAGYTLLSFVIERASGKSWEAFFDERVFGPLKMKDTQMLRSDLDIVPNMATLHVPHGAGWRRGIYPIDELIGSGGLISTIDDMLRWAAQVRGPQRAVGSAALWTRLLQRTRLTSGVESGLGLGLARETYRGVEVIHHAGATMGSQCQMITVPAHELDVVVMANRMDAPAPLLAIKIIDAVLESSLAPVEVPPPASDYPSILGAWFSRDAGMLLSIKPQKPKPDAAEALLLSLYHSPAQFLLRRGEGLSTPPSPMRNVEVRKIPAEAKPQTLEIHVGGAPERFERLPDPAPKVSEVAPALVGRYRYSEFGSEVEIVYQNDKLFLDFQPAIGRAQWELEPYSADVLGCGTFHTVPMPVVPNRAALCVERDAAGKVRGFFLQSDRYRNVRFERL